MSAVIEMVPSSEERDSLFQAFARALFAQDMDALYQTVAVDFVWSYHDGEAVTKCLGDRAAVRAHLEEQRELFSKQRFHDVVYHHLPEVSFMTFRVTETFRATGEVREQRGIERYLFRDGRIALKDVYRKPLEPGVSE
jgi:ketosteroid isomerase-like protein